MRQYRVFFLSAESVVFSHLEFTAFLQARSVPMYDVNRNVLDVIEFELEGKFYSFTRSNITHILSEDVGEGSQVVTPKSPAELRAEKERQESQQPTTLTDQLDAIPEGNK